MTFPKKQILFFRVPRRTNSFFCRGTQVWNYETARKKCDENKSYKYEDTVVVQYRTNVKVEIFVG